MNLEYGNIFGSYESSEESQIEGCHVFCIPKIAMTELDGNDGQNHEIDLRETVKAFTIMNGRVLDLTQRTITKF